MSAQLELFPQTSFDAALRSAYGWWLCSRMSASRRAMRSARWALQTHFVWLSEYLPASRETREMLAKMQQLRIYDQLLAFAPNGDRWALEHVYPDRGREHMLLYFTQPGDGFKLIGIADIIKPADYGWILRHIAALWLGMGITAADVRHIPLGATTRPEERKEQRAYLWFDTRYGRGG